ncbi:MAG: hypothetical protein LBG90_06530 [Spirochaetaceae bacterium]|jgi:hypothetical protein|nr:hypothetical protein [Spirochaetaceae bacterium]
MTEKLFPQDTAEKLLRQVPPILRARDWRLYTQNRKRLVDLWQLGGAAVLGHTPAGILREVKNTAERGLFAAFPHPKERQFAQALSRLFPGADFKIYADESAIYRAGISSLGIWRPFEQDDDPFAFALPEAGALMSPVLPWALAPKVLLFREAPPDLPASDYISPVLLAGTARSVHDLIAWGDARSRLNFSKIEKAISAGLWRRKGIYLSYFGDASYSALFQRFLDQGFLLPPDKTLPAILPGALSPGEETALAELLSSSE